MPSTFTDLEIDEWVREHQHDDREVPELPRWMVELDAASEPGEPPTCPCCGNPEHLWDEPAPEPVRWAVPGVWDDQRSPDVPVLPTVGALVAQVLSAAEQLARTDPGLLDGGRALGEAEALVAVQHTLRTALLARSKDVGERKLYEHLGYRSLAAWQRDTAPDTPASERALSRRLGTLPWLRDALRARRVSFTAASAVGKLVADVRVHLDRPDGLVDGQPGDLVLAGVCSGVLDLICQHHQGLSSDEQRHPEQAALLQALETELGRIASAPVAQLERLEQALVVLAQHLPARDLKTALEQIRYQLLPEVLEEQQREAQHKRLLSLRPNQDGTWDLRATLTPESGEQLFTALAAEARRDPANPLDTHAREALRDAAVEATTAALAGARFDEVTSGLLTEANPWAADAAGSLDEGSVRPRSRGQRLHDALGQLLSRYLNIGLGGTSSKVPVQISTIITDRTITGAPGAPPARGGSGRPLARSLVKKWWCDAHVTTLLLDHGWIPLGVVHTQRNVTGLELKALRAQFGQRCPGIGCCSGQPDPLTPLVAHHLEMFSSTGTTSMGTTLLCCEVLHDDIHLGRKVIRLRDGRFITEDGYLHPAA